MNVLYLADPTAIHNIKWVTFFSNQKEYECFIVPQKHQYERVTSEELDFLELNKIYLLKPLPDFSIVRFYKTLKGFLYLKKIVKEYKIDIIHVMYAEPSALWALGRSYFQIPMVLTSRGTDVLKVIPSFFDNGKAFYKFLSSLYKKAFLNFDFVTSTSIRQIESIKSMSDRSEGFHLVRTGIDIDLVLSDTSKFLPKALEEDKYVFFPRSMRPICNHEFSLEALNLLPERILIEYKFVFVQEDGPDKVYIDNIKTLMGQNKLAKFVFLPTVSQKEMFQLYKSSSLVIMNPISDGSPVSAMESLICGKPLILGPLNYDNDIFLEGVFRMKNWVPQELADLIVDSLSKDVSDFVKIAKENIILNANRSTEMNKVANIYSNVLKK